MESVVLVPKARGAGSEDEWVRPHILHKTVGTQKVSDGIFVGRYLKGPRARLNIFRKHQLEMAPANDAEPQRIASGCTSGHSEKVTPTQRAELEFRQPAHLAL